MNNWILSKIITIWVQIRDTYLYLFRHALIINAYVDDHTWFGIRHRNWGDDLNYYFIKEITGRPVIIYHNFKLAKWLKLRNYLCIGTLLDGIPYKNSQTIVWGSGASGADRPLTHPHLVVAVRGPLTRDYLIKQRIDCPEVYGDPALLLPRFYKPNFRGERREKRGEKELRKYRMGIIPHVIDLKHPVVEEIRKDYPEILIIDLAHYEKWTDVIDQIYSCDMILSSSLHGLIVSDAYGIPNCWIELSGKISGGYTKFRDYGTSVQRDLGEPLRIGNYSDIVLAQKRSQLGINPKINSEALLAVCPFKIRS